MDSKQKTFLIYSLVFGVILLLFTILSVISAISIYKISIEGSRNLLETRAIDIAVNIGFTLEKLGLKQDLFTDLAADDRWADLAFIALYDKHGNIVLHSNPNLTGRKKMDPYVKQVLEQKTPMRHFSKLATGERIFVLDFPLHLHKSASDKIGNKAKTKPEPYCLRIAIHPYPANSIVRRANMQLALIAGALVILWLFAIFFFWLWRKNFLLQAQLEEQKRMAALGQMAAVLAHEIRNPLSSIKGFAQYHLEQCQDPEIQEDLTIIIKETARLERLTSNLLAYARPLDLFKEEVSLQTLCQDVLKSVAVREESENIILNCSQHHIVTDREKLMQIIINLVQNSLEAVKNQKDGTVWVNIEVIDNELNIIVEDNGPGIPEEIKHHLFEPFETTKTKGTGLGLAIVKRLCDALDGKVFVGKSSHGGAKIVVKIPLTEDMDESME